MTRRPATATQPNQTVGQPDSPIPRRLAMVRRRLAEARLDALLVPSSDPHLSEYLPERWQGRRWLSGFTGSTASLVVGSDAAALFADSRYWVQAETELAGTGIELVRLAGAAGSDQFDWICRHLHRGQTLAVDGNVIGLAAADRLKREVERVGIGLRTDIDLLADVWPNRPELPSAAIYEHRAPHAALSRKDRLVQVREAMQRQDASHHFVSTLDDLAWLFNLRGADVDYNPVFLAHALVSVDEATLFVGAGKIDAALRSRLFADGVRVAGYAEAPAALAALGSASPPVRMLLDPRRITWGLRQCIPSAVTVIEAINPSTLLKSRKSSAEALHIRDAMAHDGAAMCDFYAEFERSLADSERREPISEVAIDERLTAARARRPGFIGLSFPTIAGFAANGAMPHYRATPASHSTIEGNGLLLIDSGAQYLGGTTDITRVWPVGQTSPAERRDYTLVLKGMIALSRARFPQGTLAPMLDAIARAPLWQHGLDYGHGTGHGVGYFLNVHEGPQSISKVIPEPQMAMQAGMVTSIEPGVYRPGRWGVRIENLVLAVVAETAERGAFGDFLEFETLTLCPIDTRCIDRSLLRRDEVAWLDAYHRTVRERLEPLVRGDARDWLIARTAPL